jgi:hypothetical protein
VGVQIVEHDPRLAFDQALPGLPDIFQVAAHVHDHGPADGLTALGRASPAGQHGHTFGTRHLHDRLNIGHGLREDDAERLDLIVRRVGGKEPSRERVEANLTLNRAAKLRLESGISRHDAAIDDGVGRLGTV